MQANIKDKGRGRAQLATEATAGHVTPRDHARYRAERQVRSLMQILSAESDHFHKFCRCCKKRCSDIKETTESKKIP